MTIDTIIKDGLTAMTDDAEFRRWLGKFNCVNEADCPEIEGAVWIDGFDGSLAELAFELRAEAIRRKLVTFDCIRCEMSKTKDENDCYWEGWWLDVIDPAYEIIAAIAALEGDTDG